MRLHIIAVGFGRGTPEGALTRRFRRPRLADGPATWESPPCSARKLPVSKERELKKRMADEAERLAERVPDGAHIILLDAKGKGMTSEDFAEMLGALRDAGTKDFALRHRRT